MTETAGRTTTQEGQIDPAAVMALHSPWGHDCVGGRMLGTKPCLPYRLAKALAAEQAKVARVKALAARWALVPSGSLRAALTDQPE
jgi:hypothetical protein